MRVSDMSGIFGCGSRRNIAILAGSKPGLVAMLASERRRLSEKPLHFFLERYAEAYRRELDHFIRAIGTGTAPLVGGDDVARLAPPARKLFAIAGIRCE